MDKEVKAKWIAALRSGYYAQGQGKLRDEQGQYCCLGVLCDVYNSTLWTHKPLLEEESLPAWHYGADVNTERTGGVPNLIASRLGISGHQSGLIYMNDRRKLSFSQIADWIENHL